MTTSLAWIEANRRNAQRSTGPRTAEGKAAARWNAWRHGLAGSADHAGPGEPAAHVAELAETMAAELQAPGAAGRALARRLAILATRMDRSAECELTAVAEAAARAEFDADRRAEHEGWIADLTAGDSAAIRAARAGLEGRPEGLAHLIGGWADLLDLLRAGDGAAAERAGAWLGRPGSFAPAAAADLVGPAEAELARLRRELAADGGRRRAAITLARDDAEVLASFDPGREATLARRLRRRRRARVLPRPRRDSRHPPRRRAPTDQPPSRPRRWVRSAPISRPGLPPPLGPPSARSSPPRSPSRRESPAPTSANSPGSTAEPLGPGPAPTPNVPTPVTGRRAVGRRKARRTGRGRRPAATTDGRGVRLEVASSGRVS